MDFLTESRRFPIAYDVLTPDNREGRNGRHDDRSAVRALSTDRSRHIARGDEPSQPMKGHSSGLGIWSPNISAKRLIARITRQLTTAAQAAALPLNSTLRHWRACGDSLRRFA